MNWGIVLTHLISIFFLLSGLYVIIKFLKWLGQQFMTGIRNLFHVNVSNNDISNQFTLNIGNNRIQNDRQINRSHYPRYFE